MLSPGKWHERVPKSYRENLRYRRAVLLACRRRKAYRKAVLHLCRNDIFFFVNVFIWQTNPKKVGGEIGPFVTWEFQDGLLRDTMSRLFGEYPDDMLWEKSREMGATWLALILALWLCLFHPNKRVLCISHTEEAVDKAADEGTLFAKIQFMLDHLPGWMKRDVKKRKGVFSFAGRSTISAAASTERSGVGDRVTMVLLDEFSKQREGYAIWGQTADTGPRLVIGTHYGLDSCYFDLSRRPDLTKRVLHWSLHPEKSRGLYRADESGKFCPLDKGFKYPENFVPVLLPLPSGGPFPGVRSPWYDHECRRRQSKRDVAMHLDIDPQASEDQFFDPLQVRGLIDQYACAPYWEGELTYDAEGNPGQYQKAQGGRVKMWMMPDGRGVLPQSRYSAGADVSAGTGATPSCLCVMNDRGEKVLEFVDSRLDPDGFAALCVAVMRTLSDYDGSTAKFGWEAAGPGIRFGKRVIELGYRNIYYRTAEMRLIQEISDTPGWFPTPSSKRLLLEEYRAAIYGRQLVNRSKFALEECMDFIYTARGTVDHGRQMVENDPSRSGENHGDRVIADAIMWRVGKTRYALPVEKKPETLHIGSLAGRRAFYERNTEEVWV